MNLHIIFIWLHCVSDRQLRSFFYVDAKKNIKWEIITVKMLHIPVTAFFCLPCFFFFIRVDFDAITDPIMKAKMVALKGINKVMAQNSMGMTPVVT